MKRNFFYYLFYENDADTKLCKQNNDILSNYDTVRNQAVKKIPTFFRVFLFRE
jgi:hypothetical protein